MSPKSNKISNYFTLVSWQHIWPVAALLVIALGSAFYIWRWGDQINSLHNQVATKTHSVEQLEQVNAQALSVKNDLEKISKQSNELDTLLPTRKQVLINIERLEKIAAETTNQQNISIVETPPDTKQKTTAKTKPGPLTVTLPSKFSSVDYTINLTGGYADLLNYLQLIEHQPFLTMINGIDIEADKQGRVAGSANSGQVNTTLNATLFYIKD